jgi:hypothetical protein
LPVLEHTDSGARVAHVVPVTPFALKDKYVFISLIRKYA